MKAAVSAAARRCACLIKVYLGEIVITAFGELLPLGI